MWKQLDWNSIESPGKADNVREYQSFEKWLKECYERNPLSVAIEIGSHHGLSTVCTAQYFKVIAIDLWGVDDLAANSQSEKLGMIGRADSWQEFQKNMEQFGLHGRVFATCSTSTYLDLFPPLNAEFIFIDANHDIPYPYNDAQCCKRHLSQTGLMVFHDHLRPGWGVDYPDGRPKDRMQFDPWPGVNHAVDKLIKEEGFELYDKMDGIAAIRRKTNHST